MRLSTGGFSQYLTRKALDIGFSVARMASETSRRVPQALPGLDGRTLIILLEGLGDSIAFTPALRALSRSSPGGHIDLLVNDISYEVYKTSSYVDDFLFWSGDARGGSSFFSMVSMLRANHYRVALTPSLLFRHISLTYLAGAAVRAGFDVAGRGAMLNVPLPLDREKSRVHCYLDLASALGAPGCGDGMEIEIDPGDESRADELLLRHNGGESRPLVLIHPGAKQAVNSWPPDRYARLADRLTGEMGAFVAFTGSRADVRLVSRIGSTMRSKMRSMAGGTTLRELAALLKRCDLLICPDTGVMHLGSAVGAPMVVLMGGRNSPVEWRPLSNEVSVVRREVQCSPCYQSVCPGSEVQCMESITLDDVMLAAFERLNGPGHEMIT